MHLNTNISDNLNPSISIGLKIKQSQIAIPKIRQTVSEQFKNSSEKIGLNENSTVEDSLIVQNEGNRNKINYLLTLKKTNNPSLKGVEFDHFKNSAGLVFLVLNTREWS